MSSSQISLIYRELLQPTAITSSTFLSLCTDLENSTFDKFLVTTGATALNVHRVCQGKLKKVSSFDIFGKPQSLVPISLPCPHNSNIKEDHLLATFDIGKIVMAYFNCFTEKFEIFHMYNCEDNAKGVGSEVKADLTIYEQNGKNAYPKLSVDQNNQLACTTVYGRNLIFIPLKQRTTESKEHFIIDVSHLDVVGSIVDQCFVEGYGQPAIAVLLDTSNGVPIGHSMKVRHTYSILVLAIDSNLKTASLLWRSDHLPNDSLKLYPVSMTATSSATILVISMNALLMVSRDKVTALSTNGFSAISINTDLIELHPSQLHIALELDSSHWVEMNNDTFVGTLKDGFVVRMTMSKNRCNITNLSIIARSVKTTDICVSRRRDLLFFASRDGDSILLGVNYSEQTLEESPSSTPVQKKIKLQTEPAVEEEEREQYGDTLSNLSTNADAVGKESIFNLSILDKTTVIGPIFSADYESSSSYKVEDDLFAQKMLVWDGGNYRNTGSGSLAPVASAYIAPRELRDSLHICAGIDTSGSIRRMYLGLSTSKITEKQLIGVTSIKSVSKGDVTYVFMSSEVTRVVKYELHEGNNEFLISEISKEPAAYVTVEKTIAVGFITDTIMAQVCEKGIRLISQPEETNVADHFVAAKVGNGGLGGSDSERIISADILDGYICAVTTGKTLYVLRYEASVGKLKAYVRANPTGGFKNYNDRVVKKEKENTAINISPLFHRGVLCASLFSEEFSYAPVSSSSSSSSSDASQPTKSVEFEENLFYGEDYVNEGTEILAASMDVAVDGSVHRDVSIGLADSTASVSKKRKKKKTTTTSPAAAAAAANTDPSPSKPKPIYLVAVDLFNCLRIVDLNTLQPIFTTMSLSTQHSTLTSLQDDYDEDSKDEKESTSIPYSKRQIKDVRMHRMGCSSDTTALTRLCLLAIFETGDLGLYAGTEVSSGNISAFNKVPYSFAIRKRKAKLKLRRSGKGDTDKDGEAVQFEDSNMYSIARVVGGGLNGYTGMIVSGPRPIFISSSRSSPFVIPLTFPELPHANLGTFSIAPFNVGSGSTQSRVVGISALWREFEDVGLIRNLRPSILGIYRQIDNLEIHSGGTLSSKKVAVKKTVHKCIEIKDSTQNVIEQALLKKKTHLLATSQPLEVAFNREVQTPEEIEIDNGLYSRFYPTPMLTDSCFQPNEQYGPDPVLMDRKYQLSLVQDGEVVDIWDKLEEGEMIVDSEILYLQQESASGYVRPETSRVFIGICTSTTEKNGEDSQGKGRILLFGLSYSLFESSTTAQNIPIQALLADVDRDTDKPKTLTLSQLRAGVSKSEADQSTETKKAKIEAKKSSQQQFLDSIRPKMKLLWSGYGPASVIKQFGRYILTTTGCTLYIYTLKQSGGASEVAMEPVAFYTASFYIVDVSTTKDYIILSDALHGTTFLVWREQDRSLILLARDGEYYSCISSGLIRDGALLGMVITDDEGNLQHLQYNPRKALKRLLCTADFHVGSQISILLQHRLLSLPTLPEEFARKPARQRQKSSSKLSSAAPFGARLEKVFADRSCLLAGTLDGGLAMLVPVEERVYHRLALLQQVLCTTLYAQFGLNPREYRMFQRSRERLIRKKGVLDGNILWKFLTLDIETQTEITFVMGTTIDRVLDALQDIEVSSSFF